MSKALKVKDPVLPPADSSADENVDLALTELMGPNHKQDDLQDDTREGVGRLVDFVERYLRERTAKVNPELQKRSTAISAYQKIKKA